MTNERARTELEQLYMSLSEEKKKALDVLMAQADGEKTCGTCRNEDTYHCAECENKSDYEQAQADGEYKSNKELLCDSCYRKIAGCQAKFHNPHPVDHCIEYKPIETQADGEYIKKSDMIDWLKDIRHKMKPQNYHTASEFEIAENQIWNLIQMLQMGAFPTVALPSAEPKTGYISINDVMSVFDDFMCGEVDEDGMDTFLEMLKDKAESEDKE